MWCWMWRSARLGIGSPSELPTELCECLKFPSGKELLTINSHSDWVTAVAWNADGSKLVSGSRDKTAKVFDTKTGELLVTYSGHGQPVKGVAFHPDGNEVFSSGGDNKLHRWQIAEAKKTAEVGFGGEVYKLCARRRFSAGPVRGQDRSAVRRQNAQSNSLLCRPYRMGLVGRVSSRHEARGLRWL